MKRFLLVLLAATFAVVVTPGTSLGANDHLACKLTHPKLVKAVFELPHLKFESSATSPTAPPPNNFASAGSDISECVVHVWSRLPNSIQAFGTSPNWETASCCGLVQVTTTVQDEGPEGYEYSPQYQLEAILGSTHDLISQFKGGPFVGPGLGAQEGLYFWFGSRPHIAIAFWRVHDGFIEIEVHAHTNPRPKLVALAHHIVPAFSPYG